MIRMLISVLLTFVLSPFFSWAAPFSDVDEQEEVVEEVESEPVDFDAKNYVPAKPGEARKSTTRRGFDPGDYYHPFRSALGLRVGMSIDLEAISDFSGEALLGVNYTFASDYSPNWEVGVDWASDGRGHIHGGLKFTLNEKGSFRPHYKFGALHRVDPDERLATFTDQDNYLVLGSIGVEDTFEPPLSARLDLEVAAGLQDYFIMLVGGFSWGRDR